MTGSAMTEPQSEQQPSKRWFLIAFIAVTLGVTGISLWTNLSRMWGTPPAEARGPAAGQETLEIVTVSGRHKFNVDVMRTDADRAKGLMFRQSMPQDYGMLFDFAADVNVMMWMKNTYISLDMVFIKADGTVHRVEPRTETLSERTIPAGAPVRAVLELNAGVADKIGLKPGDRIQHKMFPAK